jgi:hypothetical protein
MRTPISIGTGTAVAAVLTHGMVFSGMNWNELSPVSTYQGFFQHVLLATERLWSYAHGWPPMSHIRDFGGFYAPMVRLICPLTGFVLFWTISRRKVGIHFWKPLAMALLLIIPPGLREVSPAATPWIEAARAALIVWLMVWTVGYGTGRSAELRGRVQRALQT